MVRLLTRVCVGCGCFWGPVQWCEYQGVSSGWVKTFCNASDGVYKGEFKIGLGHLSYTTGSTMSDAAKWMNARAGA